jgi:sigma-B regulation protein RsbU (phosphoserine phosphatase)
MGPRDGVVYEALREQTSGALKRARLVRQLIEQNALRQRAEQDQLRKEVEIAARIQTSILPRSFEVQGLAIAAHMQPATEVGGDYYDVIPCPSGCWLGIGDVAGHGLQAGLVMLMIQSMVAGMVQMSPAAAPSAIVHALNLALHHNVHSRLQQDEHATLTLIRYETNGHLTFAGGHEDILVYRAKTNTVELVSTPGPWVGGARTVFGIVDSELQLHDRDVMLLYTDGVIEARNFRDEPFGLKRLCRLFGEAARGPVDRIRDRLIAVVLEWSPVLEDDVTLLVARFNQSR